VLAIAVVLAHLISWAPLTTGISDLISDGMQGFLDVVQPAAETYPAVLGFIVLSGYCIHRNGLRRQEASFPSYAVRRTFGIVPVYLLAVAAGIAIFLVARDADAATATSLAAPPTSPPGAWESRSSGPRR
jgi:peptidoglycan/LPS O-acetylase OafA/YrhL